jgi:hypothetical protein
MVAPAVHRTRAPEGRFVRSLPLHTRRSKCPSHAERRQNCDKRLCKKSGGVQNGTPFLTSPSLPDEPNWDAAFTMYGPRVAPEGAVRLVANLQNEFDLE